MFDIALVDELPKSAASVGSTEGIRGSAFLINPDSNTDLAPALEDLKIFQVKNLDSLKMKSQ